MEKEGSAGGAGVLALPPALLAAAEAAAAAPPPLAVQGGRLVVGASMLLLPGVSLVAKKTSAGAQALALLPAPLPCKRRACRWPAGLKP